MPTASAELLLATRGRGAKTWPHTLPGWGWGWGSGLVSLRVLSTSHCRGLVPTTFSPAAQQSSAPSTSGRREKPVPKYREGHPTLLSDKVPRHQRPRGKQAEMQILRAHLRRPGLSCGRDPRNVNLGSGTASVCGLSATLLMNADLGSGTFCPHWADVKGVNIVGTGGKSFVLIGEIVWRQPSPTPRFVLGQLS